MLKVFVSYASQDADTARLLCDVFQQHKVETFVAPFVIPAGERWSDMIHRQLKDADVVVALLSKDAMTNAGVQFELGAAWGMGKKVIALLFNVNLEDMPPLLGDSLAYRATSWNELRQAVEQISETLNP